MNDKSKSNLFSDAVDRGHDLGGAAKNPYDALPAIMGNFLRGPKRGLGLWFIGVAAFTIYHGMHSPNVMQMIRNKLLVAQEPAAETSALNPQSAGLPQPMVEETVLNIVGDQEFRLLKKGTTQKLRWENKTFVLKETVKGFRLNPEGKGKRYFLIRKQRSPTKWILGTGKKKRVYAVSLKGAKLSLSIFKGRSRKKKRRLYSIKMKQQSFNVYDAKKNRIRKGKIKNGAVAVRAFKKRQSGIKFDGRHHDSLAHMKFLSLPIPAPYQALMYYTHVANTQ